MVKKIVEIFVRDWMLRVVHEMLWMDDMSRRWLVLVVCMIVIDLRIRFISRMDWMIWDVVIMDVIFRGRIFWTVISVESDVFFMDFIMFIIQLWVGIRPILMNAIMCIEMFRVLFERVVGYLVMVEIKMINIVNDVRDWMMK
jgi:hypothetical protein